MSLPPQHLKRLKVKAGPVRYNECIPLAHMHLWIWLAKSNTGSNSMRHVFIFSYGWRWACCPPMGGQAHREHSCYSRWRSAPDYKPFELTHLYQMSAALEEISPYIIPILYIITSFISCLAVNKQHK